MTDRILAINPGATSTKIGYFEDDQLKLKYEKTYSYDEISQYRTIMDQYELRLKDILNYLHDQNFTQNSLDSVVGRGGLLPPVEAGAYIVDEKIIATLKNNPVLEHASNLGASLAKGVAEKYGVPDCPAYIYDPVTVDQLDDVARISGLAQIERKSIGHVLNMRAVSMKIAEEKLNKPYQECNIIVAHIGGGSSASVHTKGRIVDLISDDEALFSTERTGGLPLKELIPLCYQYSEAEVVDLVRKKGGLVSYFGTNDARIIEQKATTGDQRASLVLEAMAYQIAKTIGSFATVVNGNVDAVIMTGGIAHSDYICDKVKERVSFLAPFYRVPGEEELAALAKGARRVLRGEEAANKYS